MLRIDASKLTINADKAYYNNVLFSGIAFTCNDTQVLLANEYLNGDNIGEYRGYLKQKDFKVIYLRESLDETDEDYSCEPILWDGKKFTGIAYDFDSSYCVSEAVINDGVIIEEVSYYKNGSIESYENIGYDNGIYQIYEFDMQGAIISFSIKIKPDFHWYCLFYENEIKAFKFQGDWEGNYKKIFKEMKFPAISDIKNILSYNFYPRANISGDGIKTSWLYRLVENNRFLKVNYLRISNSSVKNFHIIEYIKQSNPRIRIDVY